MRIKGRLAKIAVVGGLSATLVATSAGFAAADEVCAYFNTGQADWVAGGGPNGSAPSSWTSWDLFHSSPGPNDIILKFQADGNLVIYNARTNAVEWATGTYGSDPAVYLDWSYGLDDGNGGILLEDANHNDICHIEGGNVQNGTARLQSDGNFVFYNTSGKAVWASWWGGRPSYRNYCEIPEHN